MSLLLSVHKLEKSMGDRQLFRGLSFGLHEKQRLGLLGPNGAGKSTLLKILSGNESFEGGEVSPRRNLKMAYVAQDDWVEDALSCLEVSQKELIAFGMDADQASIQASIYLSMAGFTDLNEKYQSLSGGWRKRLSLATALAKEPDLLLLDEPTNHLDWEGILWLEDQLKTYKNSFFVVSHDREFLKNLCEEFMEINQVYRDGYLSLKTRYDKFMEQRQEVIDSQIHMQESMSNKARRETEWLRAGVKARTTKSQSRIKEAHQLIGDLSEMKSRTRMAQAKVNIRIEEGEKRSKKLIEAKKLEIAFGDKVILKDFNILLGPKNRLGLLGENASGKTSLLKVLAKEARNYRGELFHADDLKIVYFDQKREQLNPDQNIMEFLGDGSDHVTFKGQSLHAASYASQFLFDSHRISLPIARLSGGEQARLLIAKLLLQPADILLLDEPTNDLDIATIEILEQSLNQFTGLCILVSHDRYFLRSLCNQFIALDGQGGWQNYSDMHQWLNHRTLKENSTSEVSVATSLSTSTDSKPKQKNKLSYKDKRRLENIESEIAKAEEELALAQKAVEENTDFSNHEKSSDLMKDLEEKQKVLDEVYEFWQKMEDHL